jgi:hypothetical protein
MSDQEEMQEPGKETGDNTVKNCSGEFRDCMPECWYKYQIFKKNALKNTPGTI